MKNIQECVCVCVDLESGKILNRRTKRNEMKKTKTNNDDCRIRNYTHRNSGRKFDGYKKKNNKLERSTTEMSMILELYEWIG